MTSATIRPAYSRWPYYNHFRIIERCLDTWTLDMLDEEIRRAFGDDDEWVHTRGAVIQRVFAHDVYLRRGQRDTRKRRAAVDRSGVGACPRHR